MLKLTTDKHEPSRGLSATAQLLVISPMDPHSTGLLRGTMTVKVHSRLFETVLGNLLK